MGGLATIDGGCFLLEEGSLPDLEFPLLRLDYFLFEDCGRSWFKFYYLLYLFGT